MSDYIQINPSDNVAVALRALPKGFLATIGDNTVTLAEDIPAGHKFALRDFAEGDKVISEGMKLVKTGSAINFEESKSAED